MPGGIFGNPTPVQQVGGVMAWNYLIWLAHGLLYLFITEKDIIRLK